jgi:ABC-type antimicrobial peptide transport system permease subunit
MTVTGVLLGLLLAFTLARIISSELFAVSAFDPATFVGMATVIILVSLLASYLPAKRALKVDPAEACRHE